MLYPKNTSPELDLKLFENPTGEYRATPFWAWNCRLEKEELVRQLDVLKKMGMGGAHMHVRTGMATAYLSDEYMELIGACVEKCRSEGMLAWLYDEDRWPSGAAGGLVTKDEKYRARHLRMTRMPYGTPGMEKEREENGHLLACYDVQLDENGCLASCRQIGEAETAAGDKWYAYVEQQGCSPWYNNQSYVNTLDPASMKRFIEVTHERYLEKNGKDFGGVIPAIFTDEPQFSRKQTLSFAGEARDVTLPWTDDVPDTFRRAYGEDLTAHLPELFWELPEGKVSLIRYHYHDHIAERFTEAFADQIGAWCEKHNLMLTGHMMEEPSLYSQVSMLGEAMRSYRGFQLPGIDMLCGHHEFTTAKQAQSAAHQYGRPGVLSELYGVTGWAYDFRGHKLQGDWQAALGITVRVPHLSWVSMKGEAKRDYPASINYQSPWWQDYAFVEDHFARVNTAMTRGKPVVRVGVIHPVESYWLHWGPAEQTNGVRQQLDDQFRNLTGWLLEGGIDFDFICESLLPEQCAEGSAPLQVGEMRYDAVIVPGCETLRSTTLERLEGFRSAGGQLIFLGDAPTLTDAVPDSRGEKLYAKCRQLVFSQEAILNALQPVRELEIRNADGTRTQNLLHQLRQDGDCRWLFIAHSRDPYFADMPRRQEIRIVLNRACSVQIYDTQSGKVFPADFEVKDGKTTVHAVLYDEDSLLMKLSAPGLYAPQKLPANAELFEQAAQKRLQTLPARVPYTLSEPNAYLLDKAEFALDDGPWHPQQELLRADNVLRAELGWPRRGNSIAQPWTVTEEKTEHRVRLRFTVESDIAADSVQLATEDADLAKITWNGEAVHAAPEGWYVDRSIGTVRLPGLVRGTNTLEIELPFGRRTNVEWSYLLGAFGVQLNGEARKIVPLPETLGFDSVVAQGLAHYTGNIDYILTAETAGGPLGIVIPHYRGTAVKVKLDGKDMGTVAYAPYALPLGTPAAGKHTLVLTLLGNRENGFGPLHRADTSNSWIGPDAWRSTGSAWTESYRLTAMGLTSAPWILEG